METSVSSPSLYTLNVPQAAGRERTTNSTSSEEYIMMSMKKRASSPFSNQGSRFRERVPASPHRT